MTKKKRTSKNTRRIQSHSNKADQNQGFIAKNWRLIIINKGKKSRSFYISIAFWR